MSRIIAGAAGGSTAEQRAREPDTAHDRPRQGGPVLPAGRLQRHCRRPGAGPVRGIRLAGRGERQPRRGLRGPGRIRRQGQRRLPAERGPGQHRHGPQGGLRAPLQGRIVPGPDRRRRASGTWCSWTRPTPWTSRPSLPCWPSWCRTWARGPSWWWNAPPGAPSRHGPRAWNGLPRRSTAKPGCGSPSPAWKPLDAVEAADLEPGTSRPARPNRRRRAAGPDADRAP